MLDRRPVRGGRARRRVAAFAPLDVALPDPVNLDPAAAAHAHVAARLARLDLGPLLVA